MDKESICVEVEKSKLLNLKIKTTSAGPCISKVPPGLLGKFYLGDRILDINEQMITTTDFAYSIIKTSKNDMVKVTVKRLIRGYFVELHRRNPEEGLGFSLTDGPVIASVSPGTDFARKANCAMMEKMVITHVNGQYIPFNSETRQVNMTIRDAGSRFFVILQPLDFMTELTGSAHRT
ncbi:hypothetical protein BSL78_04510 [Apostichopus japonicus]|uniref:PDZ domain-containing protein n=1 Tax=Stichopus japonicus TaxID=307972 RepID=A0A2G8LEB0_STIJA|nr:hypothetical protein BSL78_04510 [Apostichopus japonicus]